MSCFVYVFTHVFHALYVCRICAFGLRPSRDPTNTVPQHDPQQDFWNFLFSHSVSYRATLAGTLRYWYQLRCNRIASAKQASAEAMRSGGRGK